MKKPLVVLTGPTAVGKTSLSINLAKKINGSIISADSMQVYKYMDIGTAKITTEEMDNVKHYLIDEFEPFEDFNVARFLEYSKKYIEEIYKAGKIPILVGGTGFYIQAVLKDVDFKETVEDSEYRKELENIAKTKGNEFLHSMLKEVDIESANAIHANNTKRVIRALEYYKITGEKISLHNETEKSKESPYNYSYFVLNDLRENLYKRIDLRIDKMIEDGLIDEVQLLKDKGCTKEMVSMKGLGYKEILDYLDQNCTLDEAIYVLKRDTIHFAKRQLTWFKRENDVIWVNKNEFKYDENSILEYIINILRERGIYNGH